MAVDIGRRKFMAALAGTAAAWPFGVRAQQPAMPVIGWLAGGSPNNTYERYLTSFRRGLGEVGFVEGSNVTIEYRWAQEQHDRLSWLAADLVQRQVAVIAALGNVAARAAKAATSAIPIVFESGSDPVRIGLVSNLSRPDANLTGVNVLNTELEPKKLELLAEVAPQAATIGVLVNPDAPTTQTKLHDMRAAARELGRQLHVLNARTQYDFDAAFTELGQITNAALAIAADNVFSEQGELLGQLAKRYNVPTVAAHSAFTRAGGLMSYGTSIAEAHRQMGVYVGRLLKGEKVADLPVQQAGKVILTFNQASAKALGLTIPPPLLRRADEVID
jgi:putative tryptophan/tyrosine transport system substrate-binding protein